jgi:antitoxin MazE
MRISKWGNSLGVRLPKKLVEDMGLHAGDELDLVDGTGRTIAIEKSQRRQQALERLASMNLKLPADYKFDRDEANER